MSWQNDANDSRVGGARTIRPATRPFGEAAVLGERTHTAVVENQTLTRREREHEANLTPQVWKKKRPGRKESQQPARRLPPQTSQANHEEGQRLAVTGVSHTPTWLATQICWSTRNSWMFVLWSPDICTMSPPSASLTMAPLQLKRHAKRHAKGESNTTGAGRRGANVWAGSLLSTEIDVRLVPRAKEAVQSRDANAIQDNARKRL